MIFIIIMFIKQVRKIKITINNDTTPSNYDDKKW